METLSKWLIGAVILLVILLIGFSGSSTEKIVYRDNPQTQADLETCTTQGLAMVDAWDNFVKAFDDYCVLDPYNNLCSIR